MAGLVKRRYEVVIDLKKEKRLVTLGSLESQGSGIYFLLQ
jgi:hypothetical protein